MYNTYEVIIMSFNTTDLILNELLDFLKNDSVSCEDDLVWIDKKHNVGFEVFDNEIIVFYFTDHEHFEDYTSEPEACGAKYVERAIEFLKNLLSCSVRHVEYYKGRTLAKEKYFFIKENGEEEYFGGTWFGLSSFINPFAKKSEQSITWIFNREKGAFMNSYPRPEKSEDAVELIDVNDDCYIEIFENHGGYTYYIYESDYDDYHGIYFWSSPSYTYHNGIYDTKEKAKEYAFEELRSRGIN